MTYMYILIKNLKNQLNTIITIGGTYLFNMIKGAVWSDGIGTGKNQTNVITKSTDNVLIVTIFVGFRGDLNADTLLTNSDL
jgi:hypothetical protein